MIFVFMATACPFLRTFWILIGNVSNEATKLVRHLGADHTARASRHSTVQIVLLNDSAIVLKLRISLQVHEHFLALEGYALFTCLVELHDHVKLLSAQACEGAQVLLGALLGLN